MTTRLSRSLLAVATATILSLSATSGHARTVDESPSAAAMTVDALVARPVLLATTVVGAAVYVVSLPFSLLGGNASEAGEVLVLGPAKATFVRCLGCTQNGRLQEPVNPDER
ncbi:MULTISPECIES: hypothetical protein [Marinobacter]|uniref:hypothetical protein n=1 Tax=Marinobacter TaxID=2742 RepID=UPI001D099794|nr:MULTISPECIES: hypothetical protein [Marinobacter]MCG8517342.1 hypothetical protein [Pseudomonadales bacterium]MCK7567163.1 hypothetical protein [Marinobacter xestospongiae]UDL04760.1 hypothetical protein J2887_19185 [Marinobacter sp. CA1]